MLDQLIDRLRHHQPAMPDQASAEASVLVPVTNDREPRIILTRRALTMNSHAGEVAFPGGKKDAQEPDLLVTALRESEEEIGLPRDAVRLLGRLGTLQSRAGIRVTPWVGLVPPDVPLIANPQELDAIFQVPIAFFRGTPMQADHVIRWQGGEYVMPTWRYDGHMIWGLTAYIIVDLLNTAYDAGLVVPLPAAQRNAG
ncbi:MAG: CoA pyrophosphatase [Gammaproteobacteria bacterium]